VLSAVCLGNQLISGVFLAMHYVPTGLHAFMSIEHIMRDVNFGWLLRYMHANGSSMFFLCVYIHMSRGLYYDSYVFPRHVTWKSGVLIFIAMMATAFLGYILPFVIVALISLINNQKPMMQLQHMNRKISTSLFNRTNFATDTLTFEIIMKKISAWDFTLNNTEWVIFKVAIIIIMIVFIRLITHFETLQNIISSIFSSIFNAHRKIPKFTKFFVTFTKKDSY
jgi:hypothetical protein